MLLVEHDIDRVFQIADHVTVMNDGAVLVDGSVEDARNNEKVREVYIGSGASAVAAKTRLSAASANRCSSWTEWIPSTARVTFSMPCRLTCVSARSLPCSAATAPANRLC